MKFKDETAWQKAWDVNDDPYGRAAITFARDWAELMEARIDAGDALIDIARETSHAADTSGITGFMYGCAVSILSQTWEHGEELRRWHNLDTQIGTEGEKANDSGGCLNPALMNLGVKS